LAIRFPFDRFFTHAARGISRRRSVRLERRVLSGIATFLVR
jgi:hypothetical protein